MRLIVVALVTLLAGSACLLPSAAMTISDAKLLFDGSAVELRNCGVTYAGDGFFYIEELSRASGIRVEYADFRPRPGTMISAVAGHIYTNIHQERYIQAQEVATRDMGRVDPLWMQCSAVGGGSFGTGELGSGQTGIPGGTGLNNVGLYIGIRGRVESFGANFIYVSDGARSIQCVTPAGMEINPAWGYVSLTGISSLQKPRVLLPLVLIRGLVANLTWEYAGEMISMPDSPYFQMGNSHNYDDYTAYNTGNAMDETKHFIGLTAYSISRDEVTRREYRKFIQAGGYEQPVWWSTDGWAWKTGNGRTQPDFWDAVQNWGSPPGTFAQTEDHPVVGVSYYEAAAFCTWAGGHLPTEAQWERAARFSPDSIYPWGITFDAYRCNGYADPYYPGWQTAPVGSYSGGDSLFGCRDMAGNAEEWCQDWYGEYTTETLDPQGPSSGSFRVVRGGSYITSNGYPIYSLRCAKRSFAAPEVSSSIRGFRVAK